MKMEKFDVIKRNFTNFEMSMVSKATTISVIFDQDRYCESTGDRDESRDVDVCVRSFLNIRFNRQGALALPAQKIQPANSGKCSIALKTYSAQPSLSAD